MSFYQEISSYYDAIFPADAGEMAFVHRLLPRRGILLDIGCGTGNKTVLLAEGAAFVEGVDLDPGMIARAASDNARPNIRYQALDMRAMDEAFAGRRFDAILCLGNTLVHLSSPEAIREMLRTVAGLLASEGSFVLQILNYDRILDRGIMELPTLETADFRFTRAYAGGGGLLRFQTVLEDRKTGAVLRNDIPLYPLRKGELAAMLREAGFERADYFGSYRGEAHTDDSFVTIAHCHK